ncbi:hypothetical protein WJX74_010689 [Apatococcus lobatus]|uniref:K Homology domain-containing protein n=2 Tax=Apatococcus TaxID=904362 RepID=A0AAW1SPD8_9CHLO
MKRASQSVEPADAESTVTPADPNATPPEAGSLPSAGQQPAENSAAQAPNTQAEDSLPGRPAAEVVPEVPTFSGFQGSPAVDDGASSNDGDSSREPGTRRIIQEEDDTFATLDTKTDARFIVPFEAGFSLQGTNNDIISKIMAASQTDLQVRGGVNARRMIIKVAGTISAIRDAIELLMQHWGQNPTGRELSTASGDRLRLRMLVPKVLSGKVIGFRGANIKAIEAETGCYVRLEARSNLSKMYNSREVQMAGPPAALGAAVVRVLQTVACEKSYQREMLHNDHPKLVIPIPDEAVGRIIGTSGANLRNLSQRYGVSLAVSGKDNFIPGTRFRKLMVTGTTEAQRAVEAEVIEAMREVALDDGIELENTGSYTENPEDEEIPTFMDSSQRRPVSM